MPKRIGLIGVPSSGKTALAKEIAKVMGAENGPVAIVDDYAEETSDFIDIAKGFSASWYLDLNISLNRLACERQKVRDGFETVITCGTLIESSTYSMLNFDNRRPFKMENEIEDEVKRIQACMMTNACLYLDSFAYDRVYLLNRIGPVEEDEQLFNLLEEKIRESFRAFGLWENAEDLTVEATTIEEATKLRIDKIKGDLLESSDEREDIQSEGTE